MRRCCSLGVSTIRRRSRALPRRKISRCLHFASLFRRNVGAGLPHPRRIHQQIRTMNGDHTTFCRGGRPCPPVGAIANLPQRFVKNGRASYRESAASTPTNGLCVCIGASVFACVYRRADRVVRPYGCIRFRIGADKFTTLCCREGASPAPALRRYTKKWRQNHVF